MNPSITMTALIAISPGFWTELEKRPDDPDAAWRRAVKEASVKGRLVIDGWPVPDWALFGLIKKIAFEVLRIANRHPLRPTVH